MAASLGGLREGGAQAGSPEPRSRPQWRLPHSRSSSTVGCARDGRCEQSCAGWDTIVGVNAMHDGNRPFAGAKVRMPGDHRSHNRSEAFAPRWSVNANSPHSILHSLHALHCALFVWPSFSFHRGSRSSFACTQLFLLQLHVRASSQASYACYSRDDWHLVEVLIEVQQAETSWFWHYVRIVEFIFLSQGAAALRDIHFLSSRTDSPQSTLIPLRCRHSLNTS